MGAVQGRRKGRGARRVARARSETHAPTPAPPLTAPFPLPRSPAPPLPRSPAPRSAPARAGEAGAYLPIVNTLLDGVLGFDDAQFKAEISWLYPLLSGLIGCGSVEIRQRVRVVFDQRIRGMLPF